MKCMYIVAVAVALVSSAVFTGCEKKEPTLGEKIEQAGKAAGESIDKAGKAVADAAKDAAKATEKATKEASDTLKK